MNKDETAHTLSQVEDFAKRHNGDWLFRGHRSLEWKLESSLERAAKRCKVDIARYERAVWGEFRRHAHSYMTRVPADSDTMEWLAFMQDYGAPTRLLDFSESFWIALFFAFEEAETDCVVIALNKGSLGVNHSGFDYNKIIRENIESGDHTDDLIYSNQPFYTNVRMVIQKGRFVFSLNLKRSLDERLVANGGTKRLVISASLFQEIRVRLNEFNCNSRVLFHGIDGYARYFKNHTF